IALDDYDVLASLPLAERSGDCTADDAAADNDGAPRRVHCPIVARIGCLANSACVTPRRSVGSALRGITQTLDPGSALRQRGAVVPTGGAALRQHCHPRPPALSKPPRRPYPSDGAAGHGRAT